MPTYSYVCTECDNRFDAVQAFTDDALTTCDRCSGRLRKLFSPVGVVFKGSGFYHNDSRTATKASTNGSGNGQGKSGGSGSEAASASGSETGSKAGSADKSGSAGKTTAGKTTAGKKTASSDSGGKPATAAATSG